MPRQRMLKPEIWTDEGFIELTPHAKLLFIGLISHADDEGRGISSITSIRGKIFPLDVKIKDEEIAGFKAEIAATLRVRFYQVDGREYYQLDRWGDHQHIRKSQRSTIPAPEEGSPVRTLCRTSTDPMPYQCVTSTDKERKKEKKESKKVREPKQQYAEYVTMTAKEHAKLVDLYGEAWTQKLVDKLNAYKGAHGKQYDSDYMAMYSWVIKEVKPPERASPQKKTCPCCGVQYVGTSCRCGWFEGDSDAGQ